MSAVLCDLCQTAHNVTYARYHFGAAREVHLCAGCQREIFRQPVISYGGDKRWEPAPQPKKQPFGHWTPPPLGV